RSNSVKIAAEPGSQMDRDQLLTSNGSKPILITGSHCSGSTWVGKMLSASGDVAYIPAPFNLLHDPVQCGAKFKYWFTYICSENASDYEPFLRDTVHLHYSLKAKLDSLYGFLTISSWITEAASFELKRWQKKRPLLKDPLAVLSADWLASRFGMDVVITI